MRNTNDHNHHLDEIRTTCNDDLEIETFQTVIPFTTRISEAAKWNKPASLTNPDSNGVQAYKSLTQELLLTLEEE